MDQPKLPPIRHFGKVLFEPKKIVQRNQQQEVHNPNEGHLIDVVQRNINPKIKLM